MYKIIEDLSDKVKFRAMVSLNGKAPQLWECESLDPIEVDVQLEIVAENDLKDNGAAE